MCIKHTHPVTCMYTPTQSHACNTPTCSHACTHIHTNVQAHTHTHMHAPPIPSHACTHICTHMHATHLHVHMQHMLILTCMHPHTHSCAHTPYSHACTHHTQMQHKPVHTHKKPYPTTSALGQWLALNHKGWEVSSFRQTYPLGFGIDGKKSARLAPE